MVSSGRTLQIFGVYTACVGASLLFLPHILLPLVGLPPEGLWIRFMGAVVIALSSYYWVCGKHGFQPFAFASIWGRLFAVSTVAVMAVLIGKPILIAFLPLDVAGALWTWMALKKEGYFSKAA